MNQHKTSNYVKKMFGKTLTQNYNGFMSKNFLKKVALYLFVMIALVVAMRASVVGVIFPFGVSFLFALNQTKINKALLLSCYIGFSLLFEATLVACISCLFSCFGVVLIALINKLTKKQMQVYLAGIIMLLSQSAFVYFSLGTNQMFITSIASVFLSTISFYVFVTAITALDKRWRVMRFSVDEKMCIAYLVVVLFSGISNIIVFNFSVSNMLCLIILFVTSRVANPITIVPLAVFAGIGVGLNTFSVVPIAIFASWGMMMLLFRDNKKSLAAIMILAADAVMGGVLNAYGEYSLMTMMPQICGTIIVLCIPDKSLRGMFYWASSPQTILEKHMIIQGEKNIKTQLDRVAKIFLEMQNIYRTFLLAPIDQKMASAFIAEETRQSECEKCANYKKCYSENTEIRSDFETLAHIATEKGCVSFIDVPNGLSCGCTKIQSVVGRINNCAAGVKNFRGEAEQQNKSTMEIAVQLGETGKILSNLASKYSKEFVCDYDSAGDIYDELIEKDIKVCDVFCEKRGGALKSVFIAVASHDATNALIVRTVEKVLNLKVFVESIENSVEYGYVVLTLKPCGNFEFVYGVATASKKIGDESGDNFTINKISNTKYLYAIADGMGNGKKANTVSTATISLVENYYKVGFNADLIIDEVNKIMLPQGKDCFVTIDSVVVDAENGRCDFMKVGASVSVLKRKTGQQLIEGESLPAGIIESISPTFATKYLEDGDFVVLASDGVVDAFNSVERYNSYVASLKSGSPQFLAETILEEAEAINRGEKDDMTVLVVKAILK